jgi:hypothetical protein
MLQLVLQSFFAPKCISISQLITDNIKLYCGIQCCYLGKREKQTHMVCVCVCVSMNAPVMVNLEGETDPLEVLNSYLYRPFLLKYAIAFMICCFVQEKSLSVVPFVIAFPACLLLSF